jgi:streptogramin lyase
MPVGQLTLLASTLVATMILAVSSSALAAPTITEFASGTGPTDAVLGPDGNVWFVETTANKIGRVTPAGGISEFSTGLSSNAGLSGIAAGPDGNIWFAESSRDRIGRITTGATPVITEFWLGITGGSAPQDIAAGPDGNLWFTEQSGDQIARITPSGTVTEFPIPGTGNKPLAITAGPDGNLWFTEHTATGGIGRITTGATPVVTEFGPTTGLPWGIAAGPDGNLWFADGANPGAIGRITTAGAILAPFTTGLTTNGAPLDIAAGPDGNLYFTEVAGSGELGRITPAGAVTEFTTGLSHAPFGIVGGADGNIWFTEGLGSNRVGRLTVAPDATTTAAIGVHYADATLAGSVSPRSQATTYQFDWGLTSGYGTSTATISAGSGASPVAVSALISGLAPATTYHYRVAATNGAGTTLGADRTFTTASLFVAPPSPVISPIGGLPPATPPVLGRSAKLTPVSGTVLVGLPGRTDFLPLDSASTVPVGTTIDASAGTLRLTNVRDASGKLQSGSFWGGSFTVRQPRGKKTPTVLTLMTEMTCGRSRRLSSVIPAKGSVRHLWGRDNHGHFVTRGRSAVATVRGTVWLIRDTCAGTLVKVTKGAVSVRDLVKRRTVVVTAGRSYLARLK